MVQQQCAAIELQKWKMIMFWRVLTYLWLGLIEAVTLLINKAVGGGIKTVDEELVVVCH